MSAYSELLKDQRWQRRRQEILERDNRTCQECGDGTRVMHVHHRYYQWGLQPWEYDDEALMTLCAPCHEWATAHTKILKAAIRKLAPSDLLRVAGYIEGMIASRDVVDLPISDAHMAVGISDATRIPEKEITDAWQANGWGPVDIVDLEIQMAQREKTP